MEIVILGTADWNQPIATNQHFIARELCRDGFARVNFVESLGLRRPNFTRRDFARILRRSIGMVRRPQSAGARDVPAGARVFSPIVVPWHKGPAARANHFLLRRQTVFRKKERPFDVFWTYSPVTYGLESEAKHVVYHCVDLLAEFPGIDRKLIEDNERRLAKSNATAIASSEVVAKHLAKMGFRDVLLWENVAEVEAIAQRSLKVEKRDRHAVVFAGNITPKKLDYGILRELALSGLEVRIAGPRAEGAADDSDEFDELMASGVVNLGMLGPEELATELGRCSVGLIPYLITPYTTGVSPLKTYEYLAAGLSVVATDLPGVHADGEDIWREVSKAAFISRVHAMVAESAESAESADGAIRRRLDRARPHSWSARGQAARTLVAGLAVLGTR